MKKLMDWLINSFTPKMRKVCSNTWVDTIASTMKRVIPFILTGSFIYFYNVFRTYISVLPDLGKIADYSFGMLSVFVAFFSAHEAMKKLKLARYEISAGLVAIAVFMMYINPTFDTEGNMIVQFGRFGPTGILVGLIAGVFVAIIFNLYSKLKFLDENVSIPDFVSEWINNIIPITIVLAITMILVFNLKIDVFNVVISFFSPIQSFGQTLPGFILICLVPAIFYSVGISSWMFNAVTTPIFMTGIAANIAAVAAGGSATNIVTSETVYTAALITMGGIGATLTLNLLMLKAKSEKLKAIGKICLGPSIFNINEPIMFSSVVFNPLLMVPMWINCITGPIVIWTVMKLGLLNIPLKMIQVGQIPAPFSSVMITGDLRAVLVYVLLFVIYLLTWYPFFKVYDKQCLAEENEEAA